MIPITNKISLADKILVDNYKEQIESYSQQQNKAYDELCTKLDHDSSWLFDSIYNTCIEDIEHTKFITTHLFE